MAPRKKVAQKQLRDNVAAALKKVMVVQIKGKRIRCAWKYSATQDMWLDFNELGPNKIVQIYDLWKVPNAEPRVIAALDTRTATSFYNIRTDMVGPYSVRATGGANNGFSGFRFTSGIHAFDGNSDPNGTLAPSATMVSCKVYADGELVADGETIRCDRIDIEVINDVCGNNTTSFNGFATPRAVLRETIHYTVTPGSVEVSNDIKALEAVLIDRYYGIQSVSQSVFTQVHYVNGQQSGYTPINSGVTSDSGLKSANGAVDRWVYANNARTDFHVAWIDNTYGLGQRANVAATEKLAFSTNIPKTYFSLVFGANLTLTAGQVVSWRGGYIWTQPLPCPGADLAYTYNEGDRRKYVVDFIAASAGSLLETRQSERNKLATVDSKSASVTVPDRVGATGITLSSSGYGQAKLSL